MQIKAQMKLNFFQTETTVKSRLSCILKTLNQRRSHCVGIEAEEDTSKNSSSELLQMQKKQLIDLQEHFERNCNTLLVFGFNIVRYNVNFIKKYLLPVLINERDTERIVIKKGYLDYEKPIGSGSRTESALVKLRLSEIPPTGATNYSYLQKMWKQKKMQSFKDFLRWYNNKDVVPTLEAMQKPKLVRFNHNNFIGLLKLVCTLSNMANICLHISTRAKFYPFTQCDKNLLSNVREDMVGGPSMMFTGKTFVYETHIRKSRNVCKSVVGTDASQFYPYSMC